MSADTLTPRQRPKLRQPGGAFLCLLTCLMPAMGVAQQSPALFRDPPATKARQPPRAALPAAGLNTARSRYVEVELSLLRSGAVSPSLRARTGGGHRGLALNLFADAILEIEQSRAASSPDGETRYWFGTLKNQSFGQAVFSISEDLVSGSVTTDGGDFYQIRPVEAGLHEIRQVEASGGPVVDDAIPVPLSDSKDRPAEPPLAAASGGPTPIDLFVAYTNRARQFAGGTANVENLIQLAVAETNQGYRNSGVDLELRLVRTQETQYDETGVDLQITLDRLRSRSDGYMDEIHSVRDQYGADFVSLWLHGPGAGGGVVGIAYLMSSPSTSFAPWAFGVVEKNFATGPYYTMAHELGHNQGAHHDRTNASLGTGAYSYSHGYQDFQGTVRFRTVMAYANGCSSPCPTINYWANPNVLFNGEPTGVPSGQPNSADNARTLNNVRTTVAAFRPTVVHVNASPQLDNLTPSAGQGLSQTFTATYADPDGAGDIRIAYFLIQHKLDGRNSCMAVYRKDTGHLHLVNDSSTALLGPVWPGSGAISNSQCSLSGVGAAIHHDGQDLTVTLPLSFLNFSGAKRIYLRADDVSGASSGWQSLGEWSVPAEGQRAPVVVSVSPSSGLGRSQAFTATYADQNGAGDIGIAYFLIQHKLDGRNSCMVVYRKDTGHLHLVNDSSTALLGPVWPGSGAVSNGQCSLSGVGAAIHHDGQDLTVTLPLSFFDFSGAKQIYLRADDVSGASSGWQPLGEWLVPGL